MYEKKKEKEKKIKTFLRVIFVVKGDWEVGAYNLWKLQCKIR